MIVENKTVDGIDLVCFQFFYEEEINFYMLTTYGEVDLPLVVDGKLILFCSIDLTKLAFSLFPKELVKGQSIPAEVALFCDVPIAVRKIKSGKVDQKATILNCLNMFFDIFKVLNVDIPETYRMNLYAFADYLTFEKNIVEFFNTSEIKRIDVLQAFLWCVGTMLSNCKILS